MRLDGVSAGDDKWQAVANLQNVLHQSAVQGAEIHSAVGCGWLPSHSSGNADSQTPRTVLLVNKRCRQGDPYDKHLVTRTSSSQVNMSHCQF
jgi:hypothetical protein